MRNLALKNNVDLDTIYNYFKTKEELLILTTASISKEIFHFNFMKNSGHFVLFLRNYTKTIKYNSINEEVFNEEFTKMDLIDFVFIKLFWCFIKKYLMTILLIWLKKLFIKRRKFMSKAFALFTTGLEVYAFYLVIEN